MPKPVLQARSRLGVAARRGDPEAIKMARRDLAAAKIDDYITRTVAAAPPLTPAQRNHLARQLLAPSPTAGDAA